MDQENKEPELPIYNLTKEYEEQVKPLVDALYELCGRIGMPMHAIFATEVDEEGIQFRASRIGREIEGADDWAPLQFIKIVRIMKDQPVSSDELAGRLMRELNECAECANETKH